MSRQPKAAPARSRVRNELARNLGTSFPPGSRIPSVRDLAVRLEAAHGTVRWAVHDLVNEGLLVSRPRSGVFVATDLDESKLRQRAAGAPGYRSGRRVLSGRIIEIVYVDGAVHFADRIGEAFGKAIHQLGGADVQERKLDNTALRFDCRNSDAEVLACFNLDREVLCREDQTLLFVSASREYYGNHAVGFDVISVDQEQGGSVAAKALKSAGHTTACFIGATLDTATFSPTSKARLDGFLHAWGSHRNNVPLLHARFYTQAAGAEAVVRWLKLNPRPNAIFAASDELAVGFVMGALAHGLKAGRDYSIVGFDGQDIARELSEGPLTTVEVPTSLLGQRAAKLLIERLNSPELPPQRIFLGCSLLGGKTLVPRTKVA